MLIGAAAAATTKKKNKKKGGLGWSAKGDNQKQLSAPVPSTTRTAAIAATTKSNKTRKSNDDEAVRSRER